jgi:hypothetical protein
MADLKFAREYFRVALDATRELDSDHWHRCQGKVNKKMAPNRPDRAARNCCRLASASHRAPQGHGRRAPRSTCRSVPDQRARLHAARIASDRFCLQQPHHGAVHLHQILADDRVLNRKVSLRCAGRCRVMKVFFAMACGPRAMRTRRSRRKPVGLLRSPWPGLVLLPLFLLFLFLHLLLLAFFLVFLATLVSHARSCSVSMIRNGE